MKFGLSRVIVTIELKVHVLLFRFSFWLRCICSTRFKLSQLRGHNRFHPVHQILSFEHQICSVFVPIPSCAPPGPPHNQRIRFIHGDRG